MNKLFWPFKRSIKALNKAQRPLCTGTPNRNVFCPKPDYGPVEVQRSVLRNGIRVAAAKPLGAEIAAITIMYQAGSRYEFGNSLGASHFIRTMSSASGCGSSTYFKTRVLQQFGASITCTTDRQTVAFTLRCPFVVFPVVKSYLLDAACRCCFNQWELDARKASMHEDLVRLHPEQRVLDLVQKACFTGPLANSMFCERSRIDDMEENVMNCFTGYNFKVDECTVASYGMPFDETIKFAESIQFWRDAPKPRYDVMGCARGGFELYDLGPNSDTWIAVAVPGCGTTDFSCLLKHGIVAAACGVGNMAGGQHAHDRTPMPPLGSMAAADIHTQYRAFNISYRDTGVFGILAKTTSDMAYTVALCASEFLSHVGDLTFKQIEVGKNRLKLNLALHDQDCVKVSEGLALQSANNIKIDSAKTSIAMVDMLSADDISCTAKMLSSKRNFLAYAVVGDVAVVPHDITRN